MIADRVERVNAGKALTVYQLTQWAEIRRDSWTTAAAVKAPRGLPGGHSDHETMGKVPMVGVRGFEPPASTSRTPIYCQ